MSSRSVRIVLLTLCCLLVSGVGLAGMRKVGEWPAESPKVSLDIDRASRSDAVKQLAQQAGWSVVFHAPPSDPVDIHVTDQPADKVLGLLLNDGDYVATNDGGLVSIAKDATPTADAKDDAPDAAKDDAPAEDDASAEDDAKEPAKEQVKEGRSGRGPRLAIDLGDRRERGRDIVVTGRDVTVDADEVVRDITVTGGTLDLYGTATGDLTVMGGTARIHESGHVMGDATAIGGSISLSDGARIDGDVDVVGGNVEEAGDAAIGGDVQIDVRGDDDEDQSTLGRWASAASSAVTNTALLFFLGAVLLALAPRRMEKLTVEIAQRPMRSFALGLLGLVGAVVGVIALCVTVVGIPIAVVAILLGIFLAFAATCGALTTVGAALASHRSANVYVHLAVGCVAFLLAGLLPWVGGFAQAAVVLAGIGSLVSTRCAGFWPAKRGVEGAHPYR
jgi:hypothetical protein